MPNSSTIALSALSVGIALSGLVMSYRIGSKTQEKRALFAIFLLFIGMSSLPITLEFNQLIYPFHLASLLPILLALSPAIYFYVLTKTSFGAGFTFHWANKISPAVGLATMLGYFVLPGPEKAEMFIQGELPSGLLPAVLALSTFVLLGVWIFTSMLYLARIVKNLRLYRVTLRQNFSNIDSIELLWIDWLMMFLVTLWVSSALLLLGENLNFSLFFSTDILYLLLSGTLLFLIAFVSIPDLISKEALI